MARKQKNKTKWDNVYDFDLEKWYVEKEKIKKLRQNPTAIIYVRVSDRKQVSEWNGLESQEKNCRDWANNNNVKVLETFSDWWVSWAKMERKWLDAAISYLKEKNKNTQQVTYFLCTELSRISRSELIEETWKIKKAIEDTNVEIILTSSWMNISKRSTTDVFNADVQMILAKNERLVIRDRSIAWTKAKLFSWEWCLPIPVWYERISHKVNWKKKNEIVKLEPQASIIKEWLELFASWVIENQSRLLEFFNKKKLKTNHRAAKPWQIKPSFTQRIFDYEKLYFYAWFIFCPKYDVLEPVLALHEPLISMSTMGKILERLKVKWNIKVWVRKDNSEKFPLRWVLYCPVCWHPMTWGSSRWKMWVYYDYYSCKTKWCTNRENIRAELLHEEYKNLLWSLTVNKSMVKLLDDILDKMVKEKNKHLSKLADRDKKQIAEIDKKIQIASDKFSKATDERILARIEKERWDLEEQRELLVNQLKDYTMNKNETAIIYDRVKTMLVDPVNIWEHFPVSVKVLHAWVLFGGKIYYKKNEGFRTPQISSLNWLIRGLRGVNLTYGAGYGIRTHDPLDHNQML